MSRFRLGAVLAFVLAGCEGESLATVTVTDSAGTRISLTRAASLVFGRISSEPALNIGGRDVAGPTQFSDIRSVVIDRSRNLWVADGASNQVRVFRPDGTHWKTIGRTGEGPGEFRRIRILGFAGDSLVAWDDLNSRLTVVDPSDRVGRTVGTWSGEDLQPRAFALFEDGSILIVEGRILSADDLTPGATWQDTLRIMRLDVNAGGARTELARAPGAVWLWTGQTQLPLPFSINASFVLEAQALHIAAGPDFRVRVYSGGRLTEVYGVDRTRRIVTDSARDAWAAFLTQALDSAQRAESLALLAHPKIPESLPSYAQLLPSSNGEVWARIYSPDPFDVATWDVFSRDRRWLGQIQTPARFLGSAIDGDRLIGVWFDALGVEYVRAYTIDRAVPTTE